MRPSGGHANAALVSQLVQEWLGGADLSSLLQMQFGNPLRISGRFTFMVVSREQVNAVLIRPTIGW